MGKESFSNYSSDSAINFLLYYILALLFISNVQCASTKSNSSDIELVQDAIKWFPEIIEGYEEFVRKFNETEDATMFSSVHMPDHVIRHNGSNDEGQNLIILSGESETAKVPFKNVSTYLVFRSVSSTITRYTSHLAYVRNFRGEATIEWDVYSFHFHAGNYSFVTAFFPERSGPEMLTIGIGYTLTRSRRGDQNETISTQLMKPPLDKQKLQWSRKATEAPSTSTTASSDMKAVEETTTEYPMYGGAFSGDEIDGFSHPPPWSEFARHETTTEEGVEEVQIVPKRLCFGLQRNCADKPISKPKIKKACIFGLRCKESSFVDPYAVLTTSTESPLDVQQQFQKKSQYKSLEECEASEGPMKGRSMHVSNNKSTTKQVSQTTVKDSQLFPSNSNTTIVVNKPKGRSMIMAKSSDSLSQIKINGSISEQISNVSNETVVNNINKTAETLEKNLVNLTSISQSGQNSKSSNISESSSASQLINIDDISPKSINTSDNNQKISPTKADELKKPQGRSMAMTKSVKINGTMDLTENNNASEPILESSNFEIGSKSPDSEISPKSSNSSDSNQKISPTKSDEFKKPQGRSMSTPKNINITKLSTENAEVNPNISIASETSLKFSNTSAEILKLPSSTKSEEVKKPQGRSMSIAKNVKNVTSLSNNENVTNESPIVNKTSSVTEETTTTTNAPLELETTKSAPETTTRKIDTPIRKGQVFKKLKRFRFRNGTSASQSERFLARRKTRGTEDPCAEYRKVAGESMLTIQEGESSSKIGTNTSKLINGTQLKEVVTTMAPEVKEAINPFSNSLSSVTVNPKNDTPPWEESGNESTKPPTIEGEVKMESFTKVKRNFVKEEKLRFSHALKKKELDEPNGLESSKEANSEELDNETPTPAPKKEDSDPTDLENLDIPYIGIGTCDFLPPKEESLPTTSDELVAVYMNVLKVQCIPTIKIQTLKLFQDGLVKMNGSKILVNNTNPFFLQKTLGELDWMNWSSAVVLSEFSHVYEDQYKKYISHKLDNKSPNHQRLSGTVKTLTLLVLKILNSFHSSQKIHAIKFANLLLVIVQAQRSELVTTNSELDKCTKCTVEKQVNFSDQVQLYSIMRFIVDKLPEVFSMSSSTSVEKLFNQFYTTELKTIREFVKNKTPFTY